MGIYIIHSRNFTFEGYNWSKSLS